MRDVRWILIESFVIWLTWILRQRCDLSAREGIMHESRQGMLAKDVLS